LLDRADAVQTPSPQAGPEGRRGRPRRRGTPIEFNTISVTDGIAMGTEGMKASLISRDWIADSVELVARGHLLDRSRHASRLRQDDPPWSW